MEALIIGFHHFLILLVWMYFTHSFFIPKTKSWKRELQMMPLWLIFLTLSSTVWYQKPFIKIILMPVFMLCTYCYMYEYEPLRYLISIGIILLISFLSEVVFSVYILLFQNKQMQAIDMIDRLFIIPLDFFLHSILFHKIVQKQKHRSYFIQKYALLIFVFLLSQVLVAFLVGVMILFNSDRHLIAMILLLILSELICNTILWKQKEWIIADIQKQKYKNQYLKNLYANELQHYIEMKEQLDLHRTLRHDLLNEIQIITYMEKQHRF